jgi:hypothetical protein
VQASLAKSSSLFPDTINLGFFFIKKSLMIKVSRLRKKTVEKLTTAVVIGEVNPFF